MATKKSEHSGHRNRMRKKFLEYGIDIFEPHEVLEILLFYAIPMKDTNSVSHRLIDKFGSISAVIDAPYDLLVDYGLSDNVAFFLKFLPEAWAVYKNDKINNKNRIIDTDILPQKLINIYFSKKVEMAYIILLDSHFKELYSGFVSKGSANTTEINIPSICEMAVRYSAKLVILAHNHPSGCAQPSKSDFLATINLYQALKNLDILLMDHFLVADENVMSFYDEGCLFKTKNEYMESKFYNNPLYL